MKESMMRELLASWKYEKQPVTMTTAASTTPRYNCNGTEGREVVPAFITIK